MFRLVSGRYLLTSDGKEPETYSRTKDNPSNLTDTLPNALGNWDVSGIYQYQSAGANSNPTSGSFGLITGKTGERRIQLAAKYMF